MILLRVSILLGIVVSCPTGFCQTYIRPKDGSTVKVDAKSFESDSTVVDSVAETTTLMTFAHNSRRQTELEFMMTLPESTVVVSFAYWYRDEKVPAFVAEKARARRIYETITIQNRDPALIEMVGRRNFSVKVFPVDPGYDLKIEIKTVQSLTDGTFSLPVPNKPAKPLETFSAQVTFSDPGHLFTINDNYGVGISRTSAGHVFLLKGTNYRPAKDIRIRLESREEISADVYSTRSGGTDGFFSLNVRSQKFVGHCSARIEGVKTHSLHFPAGGLAPNKPFQIVGKYSGSGPAILVLSNSKGVVTRLPISFADQAIANNPASKLWAEAEIHSLGKSEKVREKAIALSMRFGLPSHFTSWIAIPVEERKAFADEIARQDFEELFGTWSSLVEKGEGNSSRAKNLAAKIKGLVAKHDLQQYLDLSLMTAVDPVFNKTTRRPYLNIIRHFADVGVDPETLLAKIIDDYSLAAPILDARVKKNSSSADKREARRAESLIEEVIVGTRLKVEQFVVEEAIFQAVRMRTAQEANRLYGVPNDSEAIDYYRFFPQIRNDVESQVAGRVHNRATWWLTREIDTFVRTQGIDSPSAKSRSEALGRAVVKATDRDMPWMSALTVGEKNVGKELMSEIISGRADGVVAQANRDVIARYCGLHHLSKAESEKLEIQLLSQSVDQTTINYFLEQYETIRDPKNFAQMEVQVNRINAFSPKILSQWSGGIFSWNPNARERDALVRALRDPKTPGSELARLEADLKRLDTQSKGESWAQARVERLKTEIEIDSLQWIKRTPEMDSQLQRLETKRKELRARMGDPLLLIDAPKDAKVIAIFPHGQIAQLVWDQQRQKFLVRFDIPTYATEGSYVVKVFIQLPDGAIATREVTYHVDITRPDVKVISWRDDTGLQLEIETEADAARCEAFDRTGKMISLTRVGNGKFVGVVTDPGPQVQIIVTDQAHNRTETTLDVAP